MPWARPIPEPSTLAASFQRFFFPEAGMAGRYLSSADLPKTIGIFPLTGILLLPRGQLPLNVFEPRYLTLVDTAMAGNRLIGMIQPLEHEEKTLTPALSS